LLSEKSLPINFEVPTLMTLPQYTFEDLEKINKRIRKVFVNAVPLPHEDILDFHVAYQIGTRNLKRKVADLESEIEGMKSNSDNVEPLL
jgi:hypothetical protein